jgi:endonuclease YncB( thermonuclease family)
MSKKVLVIFIGFVLIMSILYLMSEFVTTDETYEVSKVIDGDTITLTNGWKVRLIGINAPETGTPFAYEATEKLIELIGNQSVTLKRDTENTDQYGRLLRYVYAGNTFINLEMVKQGYAAAYSISPNLKHKRDFESAEEEAIDSGIGMWPESEFELTITKLNYDAEGDDSENLNDEYVILTNAHNVTIDMTGWRLWDMANNEYIFSDFVLDNYSSITLITGSGIDTDSELYWGSSKPVWNNDGDALYIRDSENKFVINYRY